METATETNPTAETTREFVVSFLHYSGANHEKITNADKARVIRYADGFGAGVTDPDLFWDWSHVRDSSDRAFALMARTLRDLGYCRGCETCGGAGLVLPHLTALVAVTCPTCRGVRS